MKTTSRPRPVVTADGEGVVSHAGSGLLVEVADRLGLTAALNRGLAPMRRRRAGHDPAAVLRDLAVSIADGGDCLSDLGVLREQPEVFVVVASPTAWRVLDAVTTDWGVEPLRQARAAARARASGLGMRPKSLVIDFDATLVTAQSDKQGAAGTYKRGFGFHPLLCTLDGGGDIGGDDILAGHAPSRQCRLQHGRRAHRCARRRSRAAASTPKGESRGPVLARANSAGATREFLDAFRERGIRFSVGFDLTEPVRSAVLAMPATAWMPAFTQGGAIRKGAAVCELSTLDLSACPQARGQTAAASALSRCPAHLQRS